MKRASRRTTMILHAASSPPATRAGLKRRRTIASTSELDDEKRQEDLMTTPPDAQQIPECSASLSPSKRMFCSIEEPDEAVLRARKSPVKLFGENIDLERPTVAAEEKASTKSVSKQTVWPAPSSKFLSRGARILAMVSAFKDVPTESAVKVKNEEMAPPDDLEILTNGVVEDEHPAPLESLPKFDAPRPWARHTYSPSASPRNGILKVSPSPNSCSGHRVKFRKEIDKVEIPAEGRLKSTKEATSRAKRGLRYRDTAGGGESPRKRRCISLAKEAEEEAAQVNSDASNDSLNDDVFEESKPVEDSGIGDSEEGKENSRPEPAKEEEEKYAGFFPELVDCKESVEAIVRELAPANWAHVFLKCVRNLGVATIGDFAKLKEEQVLGLPIAVSNQTAPLEFIRKKLSLFVDQPVKNPPPPEIVCVNAESNTETTLASVMELIPQLSAVDRISVMKNIFNSLGSNEEKRGPLKTLLKENLLVLSSADIVDCVDNHDDLVDTILLRQGMSHERFSRLATAAGDDALRHTLQTEEKWRKSLLRISAERDLSEFSETFVEALNTSETHGVESVNVCSKIFSSMPGEQRRLLGKRNMDFLVSAASNAHLPEFFNKLKQHLNVDSWRAFRKHLQPDFTEEDCGTQTEAQPEYEFVASLEELQARNSRGVIQRSTLILFWRIVPFFPPLDYFPKTWQDFFVNKTSMYRDCFYLYARDGHIVTLDELSVIMRSLGTSPTIIELRKYLKDKNGRMSFADFLEVMHTHTQKENISEEIKKAFRAHDVGRKGVISARDLRHVLLRWGERLMDQIFREAKIAPNGMVNYDQFVKIVCAPVPDYY
ncbi:unnamed protein product [Notodromas monacha]|uniref:EF-hand domain-containing protein n=1 Tax=Notodromas monacha TaxID=399045 RepID=A0A7R9G9Y3_9CRUS|nr:unnamed protein product [Notodromas monacha]CAG0914782.1 unnamed protein product [Notodromas monacha]